MRTDAVTPVCSGLIGRERLISRELTKRAALAAELKAEPRVNPLSSHSGVAQWAVPHGRFDPLPFVLFVSCVTICSVASRE